MPSEKGPFEDEAEEAGGRIYAVCKDELVSDRRGQDLENAFPGDGRRQAIGVAHFKWGGVGRHEKFEPIGIQLLPP